MAKRYLTKKEVLINFSALWREQKQYRKDDTIAKREAWNNYTDALCKDGEISSKQYDTWTNPF